MQLITISVNVKAVKQLDLNKFCEIVLGGEEKEIRVFFEKSRSVKYLLWMLIWNFDGATNWLLFVSLLIDKSEFKYIISYVRLILIT